MCVHRAGEVFSARTEVDRERRLGDQVRAPRPENVEADDAVGPAVGEDLDAAIRVAEAAGAAARHERERPDRYRDAAARRFLLAPADARELRPGVHDV